jgi:multiple sugar transport system permease protein
VFVKAAANTAYFVVVGVPLTLGVALLAAVALDKGITRFRAVYRLGFYTPVITSIVAVAVVWRFLLQPDSGLVNTVLSWVGIAGPNWLGDVQWSMPSLILMATWRNFGTGMIIFLAGLQAVPASLQEAAAIDGASGWQRFWHITFPLLRPTLLFVSVTTAIGYLQFFEEPFVMTQGGPLNSTISLSMYTYNQFGYGNYGLAAAMSYLIFIVIAVVTALQFRLLRENT